MKRLFKLLIGIIAIIVGVIALLTPFTPGSWLILVGFGIIFGKKMPPWLLHWGKHKG